MPASHPPSYCHLIFAPKLGLTWLPMDSTLDWLLFSLEYGCVCVFRGAGQRLCVVGTPRPPPWGSNLISLLLPVGKGGQQQHRGRRGQGRGSFLKERKPGSLGTEKPRVPPSLLWASCPLLLLQPTPGMGINRDFALSHY